MRLSEELYEEIAAWAVDDFRSINGQIEFLLTESVRRRRRKDDSTENGQIKPDGDGK